MNTYKTTQHLTLPPGISQDNAMTQCRVKASLTSRGLQLHTWPENTSFFRSLNDTASFIANSRVTPISDGGDPEAMLPKRAVGAGPPLEPPAGGKAPTIGFCFCVNSAEKTSRRVLALSAPLRPSIKNTHGNKST
ncbi:hypothetical protein J3459_012169 [Metarhizium acridum]|nr:hypothetical protein J3459_012169 [Metarhizium acridum]